METLGNKQIARILNRRGRRINLPQPLEPGEFGWCQDTRQLFVGIDDNNAIPTIEVYPAVNVSTQVNPLINNQIIQFNTPQIRLNDGEDNIMIQIGEIPASAYVYGRNKKSIVDLENQVAALVDIKNTILSAIASIGSYPSTLLYSWVTNTPLTAIATGGQTAGVVDTITITNGGSGYTYLPTISISGDGSNAVAYAITTNGVLTGYNIVNGGTGYTTVAVNVSAPITPSIKSLKSISINTGGSGYVEGDLLTVASGSGTLAKLIVTSTNVGAVDGIAIHDGGTNYLDTNVGVTVTGGTGTGFTFDIDEVFDTAQTDSLYTYTMHLGISEATSGAIINSELASVIYDMSLNPLIVNAGVFGTNTYSDGSASTVAINAAGTGYVVSDILTLSGGTGTGLILTVSSIGGGGDITGITITNAGSGYLDTDTGLTESGGTGSGATFDISSITDSMNAYNNAFLGGELMMPTPRQTSNVSGLINLLSIDSGSSLYGLTNTKQNVEILTEESISSLTTLPPDYLVPNSIVYRLIPTAVHPTIGSFSQVVDNDAVSADLEYPVVESDVQHIEYSVTLDGNDYSRTGTLRIVTAADNTVNIDDDYVVSVGAGLTPIGADIDFYAIYSAGNVMVQYRHNFVEDAIFKITIRRWLDF